MLVIKINQIMKNIRPIIISTILLFAIAFQSFSQDSLKTNDFIPRKNVIRYNLTPNLMGFSSAIFGYERVVKSHQSFSINAGYLSIGKSNKENGDYKLTSTKSSSGFSIAADYRFYLKKENKNPAPSGIYLAPYLLHYNLNLSTGIKSLTDNSTSQEVIIDSRIRIYNVGLELGYQFNIKNRFTIDLILVGPSYGGYRVNMDVAGGVQPPDDDLDETLEALRDILFAKYPWLETLIDEGEVDVRGNKTHWGMGFRYVLQIGYRF